MVWHDVKPFSIHFAFQRSSPFGGIAVATGFWLASRPVNDVRYQRIYISSLGFRLYTTGAKIPHRHLCSFVFLVQEVGEGPRGGLRLFGRQVKVVGSQRQASDKKVLVMISMLNAEQTNGLVSRWALLSFDKSFRRRIHSSAYSERPHFVAKICGCGWNHKYLKFCFHFASRSQLRIWKQRKFSKSMYHKTKFVWIYIFYQ